MSSTRIRALVQQGDVAAAERLLGRPFGYDFEIGRGRQLGRTMGTPTINQGFTEGFVLPRFGVYASLVSLNDGDYYGVTNVGVKPPVGADAPLSETWIPEYHGAELYGENIRAVSYTHLQSPRPRRSLPPSRNRRRPRRNKRPNGRKFRTGVHPVRIIGIGCGCRTRGKQGNGAARPTDGCTQRVQKRWGRIPQAAVVFI